MDWFHGSAAERQQQRVEYDRKVYSLTINFTTIFPCLQVGTIFLKKVLYKSEICVIITFALWGRSSAGRAFGSHPRGREFESLRLHHKPTVILIELRWAFLVCESALWYYDFDKSEFAGVIDENCRSYRKQKTIS